LGSTYWLDATKGWAVTNPLGGSSSTEQWDTGGAYAGTTSHMVNVALVFYHQYALTMNYLVVGGAASTAPGLTGTVWGKTGLIASLATTPTGYWLDAGSPWSVTNPLGGSSSTERWQTASATSGKASAGTLTFTYNNQFFVTFADSPSGDGTVSPSSGWFNAGATVSITAKAAAGFVFSSWASGTPGITIASATSASTPATINGAGTVTAKSA